MIKKIKLTANITRVLATKLLAVKGQSTVARGYGHKPDYKEECSVLYFEDDDHSVEWEVYRYMTGQNPTEGLQYLGTVMLANTEYVEHFYASC